MILLGAITTMSAQTTKWTLDKSHTDIRFTVTHMTISEVDGEFKDFDGSLTSTCPDFHNSDISFTAKVASINTDNERRDNHLKGDDFFNAEQYPEVKFGGKLIKQGKKYYLQGNFTMRDVTKPIKFDVQYLGQIPGQRGAKAGFKINGSVNRFDYGLKWNRAIETGGLVVGENVKITCNIELNEVKAPAEGTK